MSKRPKIVCLCGSTRFMEAFRKANLEETLAGHIILTVGCDTKSDDTLGISPEVKAKLDELHLAKIDLSDEVFILNVGGYIGESTLRELAYAVARDKGLRFLDPERGDLFMASHTHELGKLVAGFVFGSEHPAKREIT